MITIQENRGVEKFGDVPEEKEFVIQNSPKAFRVLIGNLYSDKVGAVIRELSANAVDSHTEKGHNNPFEVNLPTRFEPVITIRDFGTGISHEFMLNKYIAAFCSSKDKSNDFMGALGLGRLSALSLCDNYTCSSFLDGARRNYSVFINDNGIPSIMFLGSEETSEPNGFLVEVPVSPELVAAFESKAKEVYQHYKIRPIIKNRTDFQFPNPKDNYLLFSAEHNFGLMGAGKNSVAIMGTYSYPIDTDSISNPDPVHTQLLKLGIVLNFPIGALDVQANREGLHYNQITINNIKAKLNEIVPLIKPLVLARFKDKNVFQRSALKYDLMSYNGKLASLSGLVKEFINELNIPSQFDFEDCQVISFTCDYHRGRERVRKSEISAIEFRDNVILYLTDRKSNLRLKADKFFETAENKGKRIIFIYPYDNAINKFKVKYEFDLNILPKASVLPFVKPVAGQREFNVMQFAGAYSYRRSRATNAQDWEADEDFDPDDEVVYVERFGYSFTGSAILGYTNESLKEKIKHFNKLTGTTITLYGLTPRQIKNKKNHWQTFENAYQKAVNDYANTQVEKISAWKYFYQNYQGFPKRIVDALTIEPNSLCEKIKIEYDALSALVADVDKQTAEKSNVEISTKYSWSTQALKERYPLLFCLYDGWDGADTKQDLKDYIILKG